jgi:enoyl-CoA hydratase
MQSPSKNKERHRMNTRYSRLGSQLQVEVMDSVRVVRLNAPERLNAVDTPLHEDLALVWDLLFDDEDASAVVLTGEGRAFCAGGYFGDFLRYHEDPAFINEACRVAERITRSMIACELPIIAAVNGPAIGLGASLATMCDIILMSENAYICDPHVNVGVVAGDGGPVVWPLLTSLARAKEYLFLGDKIDAATCERIGLANRVLAPDELMPYALNLALRLAAQPKQALRQTKRVLNQHLQQAVSLVLNYGLAAEAASFQSTEVRATIERFQRSESAQADSQLEGETAS